MDAEIKNFYNTLLQCVKLVAASYEDQVASLPEFVDVPDEIALIYNDSYLLVPQLQQENLISSKVLVLLRELDKLFEKMSEDSSLWTLEKLKYDNTWKKSRELACEILKMLNESNDLPNLSFINWAK